MIKSLLKAMTGHEWVLEHRFHEKRKWRFDYALPDLKIAIEQEGGVFTQGRHTRGLGYLSDMEKYNTAALMGWMVLRFTPEQLKTNRTFEIINEAIKLRQ